MNLYLVILWDEGHPQVRAYTEGTVARLDYDFFIQHFEHVYFYTSDESGHMELILETERLPQVEPEAYTPAHDDD